MAYLATQSFTYMDSRALHEACFRLSVSDELNTHFCPLSQLRDRVCPLSREDWTPQLEWEFYLVNKAQMWGATLLH